MTKLEIDNTRKYCGEGLKKMAPLLDKGDLKAAQQEFKMSARTVKRYMSGQVHNLSHGLTLLNYFRKLLDRRLKKLKDEMKKTKTVTEALLKIKENKTE
jgi:hypothetical protein